MKLFKILILSQVLIQSQSISPLADDEYDKYTSVGNLGLTITNFGILGNGWNRMEDGSINPSCQYKQQTEISREQIEHFSYAGLWVGVLLMEREEFQLQSLMEFLKLEMKGLSFSLNLQLRFNPLYPRQHKIQWQNTTLPMLYLIKSFYHIFHYH